MSNHEQDPRRDYLFKEQPPGWPQGPSWPSMPKWPELPVQLGEIPGYSTGSISDPELPADMYDPAHPLAATPPGERSAE